MKSCRKKLRLKSRVSRSSCCDDVKLCKHHFHMLHRSSHSTTIFLSLSLRVARVWRGKSSQRRVNRRRRQILCVSENSISLSSSSSHILHAVVVVDVFFVCSNVDNFSTLFFPLLLWDSEISIQNVSSVFVQLPSRHRACAYGASIKNTYFF